MSRFAVKGDKTDKCELPDGDFVDVKVSTFPLENGRRDRHVHELPVKLLVAYEIGDREERWEVGRFSAVNEAVAAAKAMVDTFLLQHHQTHLRGRQLYDHFVNNGPEVYVDASVGGPVFHGWEYARKRVRQLCGGW